MIKIHLLFSNIPQSPKNIAAKKPTITTITPPPMPGPRYAYEGKEIKNIDKNKIDLFIASSFVG